MSQFYQKIYGIPCLENDVLLVVYFFLLLDFVVFVGFCWILLEFNVFHCLALGFVCLLLFFIGFRWLLVGNHWHFVGKTWISVGILIGFCWQPVVNRCFLLSSAFFCLIFEKKQSWHAYCLVITGGQYENIRY